MTEAIEQTSAALKKRSVEIICEAFEDNPSVLSVISDKEKGKQKRLAGLAKFVTNTSARRNGLFLSKDNNAVALCYKYNFRKDGIMDYIDQLLLVFRCIGLKRVASVMRREKLVKEHRPASGDFLYFWFFGANAKAKGRGAALELKEKIFTLAAENNLPICLETSVEKNRRVYERFGFTTYYQWPYNKGQNTLYFMIKHP